MRKTGRLLSGFTLIELLVVMGIILFMIALVLVSVGSMMRSSRMSRAMALVVGAVDEARTASVTLRRSTKVDLTRVDEEGRINRLTVVGPFFSDNFDGYKNAVMEAPMTAQDPLPATNGWMTSGSWVANSNASPSIWSDGTRCLRMATDQTYWNIGSRIDTVKQEDFEMTVMGRVKFLPVAARTAVREIQVFGAIQPAGVNISKAYLLRLRIEPAAAALGRNMTSFVRLDPFGGGALVPLAGAPNTQQADVDVAGNPSATTCLVENVWYRVSLSVKLISDPVTNTKRAIVAGKVWADGQLEPWGWTCGPLADNTPLSNGPGGFGTLGGDALLDDVLFDARPTRIIPVGLRIDAMRANPATPESTSAADWEVAPEESPFNFPILFRPDGTAADRYVLRITDFTSGDKRYVTIGQSSGRARLEHSLQDAIQR